MKRVIAVSLIFSLIISLVAPMGAVFAVEADVGSQSNAEIDEETLSSEAEVEVASESREITVSGELTDDSAELPVETDKATERQDSVEDPEPTVQVTDVQASSIALADKSLVISYVQASGAFGRYVEIRNASSIDYHTKGLTLSYVRATGSNVNNPDVLATFYGTIKAGGIVVIGDNMISDSADQNADLYYTPATTTVMSTDGGWLRLVDGATELDSFCWSSSANPPCGDDRYIPKRDATGSAIDYTAYERCFGDDGSVVVCRQNDDGTRVVFRATERRSAKSSGGYVPFYNNCLGLEVSEVAPKLIDQFIEIYNSGDTEVSLERCILQINNSIYQFSWRDDPIDAKEYRIISPAAISSTLARTTAGEVRLLSSSGEVVNNLKYSTPKDDRSIIRDEDGNSVWTLKPTPGTTNEYVQYAPCEEGYWRNEETGRCNKTVEVATLTDCGEGRERNPATGRCRNIPTAKEYAPCKDGQYRSEETNRCRNIALAGSTLKPCKEGQYRSEETNRCRSIASAASTLKPCREDQFRNPETNRCKKIASADELADCGEGRERNPATNRCRNVLASTVPTADFSAENVQQVAGATWGWWVFGGVSVLALGYAGWQWRWELKQLAIRSRSIFTRSGK